MVNKGGERNPATGELGSEKTVWLLNKSGKVKTVELVKKAMEPARREL